MNDREKISIAESIVGYKFRNVSLLETALTHSSYANEHKGVEDNEKLEFLGDALLNFISAKRLFGSGDSEGVMTKTRSGIVSREPLKKAIEDMGLLSYVRFGKSLGRQKLSDKTVSDLFEAILGAIYVDSQSVAEAERFVVAKLKEESVSVDFKSELQEILQADGRSARYETVDVGDVHNPYFSSRVYERNELLGEGEGRTKKDAEKNAAKQALKRVKTKVMVK